MNQIIIVDPTQGDKTMTWDTQDAVAQRKAREEFLARIKKGYTGLTKDGRVVRSFDATEETTYLLMPVCGG